MWKPILQILLFLLLLASLVLNFSCLRELPKKNLDLLSIDRISFLLQHDEHGFRLHYGPQTPLQIPREWLIPRDESERDKRSYVSSFNYDEHVTAFPVGNGMTGLHLSSYEIQTEGSAQAAAGRDVFLVFNEKEGSLHQGRLSLGISKERVRFMGCPFAAFLRFIVGDINKDNSNDIGIVREEIKCEETYNEIKEVDHWTGPFYEKRPIIWYVFAGDHWTYNPNYKGQYPNDYIELPLISLKRSPVDIVKDLYQPIINKGIALGTEQMPNVEKQTIVLSYSDFGPQVLAHELIGYEWYQWDRVGDCDPSTKYDVKVIVYKNITLKEVQECYSVNRDMMQDYRYVEYSEALKYFNEHIKAFKDLEKTDSKRFVESAADILVSNFQNTKRKILMKLDQ